MGEFLQIEDVLYIWNAEDAAEGVSRENEDAHSVNRTDCRCREAGCESVF